MISKTWKSDSALEIVKEQFSQLQVLFNVKWGRLPGAACSGQC